MATPAKHPEKLLTVQDLVYLTGFHPNTVRKLMKSGPLRKGLVVLNGEYRCPVSVYNAWVDAATVKEAA
jgi:hypothetical protein